MSGLHADVDYPQGTLLILLAWLLQELSASGSYLLFRGRHASLHLHSLATAETRLLLKSCSYCQWVPDLDVVVAQTGATLHVWYSAGCPGSAATTAVQGAAESITNFQVCFQIWLLRDKRGQEAIM